MCGGLAMNGNPAAKRVTDHAVYNLLRKIPQGSVSTYGDIASALGNPNASRAVGRILGRNPNPVVVPCHRVVRSDGTLGGYTGGVKRKRELLEKEGLTFSGDSLNNFERVRAPPVVGIGIVEAERHRIGDHLVRVFVEIVDRNDLAFHG